MVLHGLRSFILNKKNVEYFLHTGRNLITRLVSWFQTSNLKKLRLVGTLFFGQTFSSFHHYLLSVLFFKDSIS